MQTPQILNVYQMLALWIIASLEPYGSNKALLVYFLHVRIELLI